MKITEILATRSELHFRVDAGEKSLKLVERVPVVGGDKGRILEETRCEVKGGIASIPRFSDKHDRLASRFELFAGGEKLEGACYVTDMSEDLADNREPYPQPDTIKALGCSSAEEVARLGVKQTLMNINLMQLMTTEPDVDDIAFEHDGHTYYFIRSQVEGCDRSIRRNTEMGLITTLILLNCPHGFGCSGKDKRLLDIAVHPDYDWNFHDAFISAFNVEQEDGLGYYGAFVEFLAERYTRSDRRYGFAPGMIISNEVDSQYVWGNAGDKTCREYFEEYTQAMRHAWHCARKHYANMRIYTSFDHYWDGLCHNVTQPTRYYPSRQCVEEIARCCRRDGDFDWNVAFHPYPEDLSWCNFWMDRSPNFTFSTPRITFKNMEMLEAYMGQPHMRYRGAPRRIIFSEQGFNSRGDGLKEITEEWAAAAYVLAYMKARKMKTLDLFTHHAYRDNPHEFGLNLGVRRYDPDAPGGLGECKPIYYAIEDMDTEREPERIEKARKVIGEALFDYLLDPPIQTGERDNSLDGDFFSQPRKEQKSDFPAGNSGN